MRCTPSRDALTEHHKFSFWPVLRVPRRVGRSPYGAEGEVAALTNVAWASALAIASACAPRSDADAHPPFEDEAAQAPPGSKLQGEELPQFHGIGAERLRALGEPHAPAGSVHIRDAGPEGFERGRDGGRGTSGRGAASGGQEDGQTERGQTRGCATSVQ